MEILVKMIIISCLIISCSIFSYLIFVAQLSLLRRSEQRKSLLCTGAVNCFTENTEIQLYKYTEIRKYGNYEIQKILSTNSVNCFIENTTETVH